MSSSSAAHVVAHGLVRRFGDLTAVDGIDLDVGEGEIFGFLGPNGAGKSTTFRMLVTLLKPSAGSATDAGFDVASSRTRFVADWGRSPGRSRSIH